MPSDNGRGIIYLNGNSRTLEFVRHDTPCPPSANDSNRFHSDPPNGALNIDSRVPPMDVPHLARFSGAGVRLARATRWAVWSLCSLMYSVSGSK
jgi:hypothetical protein